MKYYKVWFDEENPIAVICDRADFGRYDEYFYLEGKHVEDGEWDESITFYGKNVTLEDYLCTVYNLVLFSEKVKQIFEELRVKGVQFLTVKVKLMLTGEYVEGYYFVNILNKIAALDLTESDYTRDQDDPARITGIMKCALKKDVVEAYDIFRLSEFDISFYISERVKKAIEKAGCTGFSFRKVRVV